jgi:hypothetical protein
VSAALAYLRTESNDDRERGVRVSGHAAEFGEPALVIVRLMIDRSTSVGQRNLSPSTARRLAAALLAAADAAESAP